MRGKKFLLSLDYSITGRGTQRKFLPLNVRDTLLGGVAAVVFHPGLAPNLCFTAEKMAYKMLTAFEVDSCGRRPND